ncbi:MAG: sensor domain-containing diguanylate cyclase [Synechococcaceae cyanobacterium]|nr:sensor domain-containing diguanylate cyclase [Synechococcaceae cyanobacterium]
MAYPAYPIPPDEQQRLRDLERQGVIGIDSDVHFERIVELARSLFHTPIAVISLVEADRQWFLSHPGLDVCETPRDQAFCAHAIAAEGSLVVPDARLDERFASNPLVTGVPHIRFYAGAPLRSPEGHNLGTLCVIDQEPHHPGPEQIQQLQLLADLVMREIELRRLASLCPITGLPTRHRFLAIGAREFARARSDGHPLSLLLLDVDNLRQVNSRWGHEAGDRLLADLVQLGRSFLREQDFAARLGDSEFALLLVDRAPEAAMVEAEALRHAALAMVGVWSPSDWQLHLSGGLTALGRHDHSFTDLLLRAERALQLAKTNGRNQIATVLDGV